MPRPRSSRLAASMNAALAVAMIAMAGLAAPACGGDKNGMRKVEVPQGGIQLAYDLTPGAAYQGHVRIGNTQQIEGVGSISQALECDVKLVVLGADPERSGAQVRATLSNIVLDWGLPPSAPFSVDEFAKQAVAQLQGMQVTFNVLPTGEITFMPVPPQELDDQVKEVIFQVLRALEQGFLVMPKHKVGEGETWTENEKRGREGKLGRFVDGKVMTKVEGMFRHETRPEDVVSLKIELQRKETITTKDGARTNEIHGKSSALFSTQGYLAEVDGETREYDPKQGMNFRKVRVQWKKTAKGHAGSGGGDVQTIDDPCHPDYVGPAECKSAESQAEGDPCHPDYVGAEACKEAAPTQPTPPGPNDGPPPPTTPPASAPPQP
jgi:hypothetical protein